MDAQRYAVVDTATGLVINVVMWDGKTAWSPPDGCEAHLSETAGIEDKWDGDTPIAVAAPQKKK